MQIVTYSSLDTFRNCRKNYWWKFEQAVQPMEKAWNLRFGKAVHEALEIWHKNYNLHELQEKIESLYPQKGFDPEEKKDYLLLNGMMYGYVDKYTGQTEEEFDIITLEQKFKTNIINPSTGAKSKSFKLAGKVDGVVQIKETGEFYLIEHKTASQIDGGYLERLWTDFQIRLYKPAMEKELNIKIAGVIYNILGKTRIRQKQKELDEEFLARLDEFYKKPEALHREKIYFTENDEQLIQAEIWELTQNILQAKRNGMWYQNTSYCFHWNRACPYYPLCRANGKHQILLENEYEIKPAHEELESSLTA